MTGRAILMTGVLLVLAVVVLGAIWMYIPEEHEGRPEPILSHESLPYGVVRFVDEQAGVVCCVTSTSYKEVSRACPLTRRIWR